MEYVKYIKCTNCKGTGNVQLVQRAKGLARCPVCKGTGKKKVVYEQKE